MANEPGRSVASRLLALLFVFQDGSPALSLADIVRATGIPHATARRLIHELADAGALDQLPDGRFSVGLRLWQLGTRAPRTESLRTLARPFMEDLHTALQQHVQLAVIEGNDAVIIERRSAPGALGLLSRVGGRLPLHCSGAGKVLLSHSLQDFSDAILAGPLRRFTPRTIVDPVELRKQMAACRVTGTAIVQEELTVGADSVATRIVNGEGRVVAALSVVVSTNSVALQPTAAAVLASGLGLSRLLGWKPGITVKAG
ncbi:IclR family transcriptional regulator [Microbacterium sp. NPDC058062]|uniref:IclR family transcriptional regulator n=1 Tax=Microbacterium sp. NPDC058062 TaxID=3346320 RepID=UPI0036DD216A